MLTIRGPADHSIQVMICEQIGDGSESQSNAEDARFGLHSPGREGARTTRLKPLQVVTDRIVSGRRRPWHRVQRSARSAREGIPGREML